MLPPQSTLATELFRELSTAFAVEAQNLLGVSLEGRIVKSGDKQLALVLEQKGHGWIEEQVKGSEVVRSWEGRFAP